MVSLLDFETKKWFITFSFDFSNKHEFHFHFNELMTNKDNTEKIKNFFSSMICF